MTKMTKNERAIGLLCCILASTVSALADPAGASSALSRFVGEYFGRAREGFCGNSRVADYDGIMARHGVTDEQMGIVLPVVVNQCLDADIPRAVQTNDLCAAALRMMLKYGTPDSAPAAERAYFDASGAFKSVSRRALFSCATNVAQVAGFVTRVWTSPSDATNPDRIALISAVDGWIKCQTNQVANAKIVLEETFAPYAACETNAAVALRLDILLNSLSADYAISALRTNLVWRFKDDRSALKDPEYFSRLADQMDVGREVK